MCVCVVRGERFCFWGFLVGLEGWMMYGDDCLEGVLYGSLIDRVMFCFCFCFVERHARYFISCDSRKDLVILLT